jgi:hypothetical protein
MFGLNHEDGGVLEFLLVLVGDEPGFGSYVANAALSFWISCHSSTIAFLRKMRYDVTELNGVKNIET